MHAPLVDGRAAQADDLGRQPGGDRAAATRRPGEQQAQAQVREREVQQENPQAAGDDGGQGLDGEHDQRDRHQAGNGLRHELAQTRGEPDSGEHRPQAGVTSPQPRGEDIRASRQPERFSEVPADGAKQRRGPRKLKAVGWSRVAACRSSWVLADRGDDRGRGLSAPFRPVVLSASRPRRRSVTDQPKLPGVLRLYPAFARLDSVISRNRLISDAYQAGPTAPAGPRRRDAETPRRQSPGGPPG